MENDFYIGWSDDNPDHLGRFKRLFLWIALLVVVALAWLIIKTEEPFVDSEYYGALREFEGQLVDYPVLGLRTMVDGELKTVPLIGFGKFSAYGAFADYDLEELTNSTVALRGVTVAYQGRMWMEMTEGAEAVLEVKAGMAMPRRIRKEGAATIEGEIIDPKCFFGVMKPAYKKIHRSCAIRCLSGGIPPVLAVREGGKFTDYYFILDQEGNPITENVMAYAGLPISLSGDVEIVDDWKVLKLNQLVRRLALASLRLDQQVSTCD